MNVNLIEVAQQNPDLIVSLKLGELLEFGQTIANAVIEAHPEPEPVQAEEKWLTRNEVIEIFGISSATLWRWKKCGYLVPSRVGSMDRYSMTSINEILKKNGGYD